MEIKKGSRIAVIGAGISDIAAPKILKKTHACSAHLGAVNSNSRLQKKRNKALK